MHGLTHQVMIEASNLSIAYETFVALHTDHLAQSGNIIAVLGHNGAGKSTFIKGVLGLLPLKSGTLNITAIEGEKRTALVPEYHMAFCPEVGSVFTDISVESYIKLWCRIKHEDPKYYRGPGARFIELLELAPLMRKRGRELSKGQRRRVQTAIGFLINPELFLFDEPFDGLDVQKTSELAEIIREESSHMSFIISSHRMDVVERLADLLIVLKDGEFFAAGQVDDVCRTLCGTTYILSATTSPELLQEAALRAFPETLVNRIGHQISVTGRGLSRDVMSRFANQAGLNLSALEEIQPSLVDAMNYHLRGIQPQHHTLNAG